jgi:hypothetical protein
MPDKLLFAITPKIGFYHSNNEMAYLDGTIQCYYPSNVGEPDGYVYFTFYPDGTTDRFQVRLWSIAKANQKMRAEFDIETTYMGDTNDFFFLIAAGSFKPLKKISILGAKREILKVEYTTDAGGAALMAMYATKRVFDNYVFILRKISVYQI